MPLSDERMQLLADAIGSMQTIMHVGGILFTVWLVWADGVSVQTMLVLAAVSIVGGAATAVAILLEENIAERIRVRSARPAEDHNRDLGEFGPVKRIVVLGVCSTLMLFGTMCLAPAVVAGLLCAEFAFGNAGRCVGNWTSAAAWALALYGIFPLIVFFLTFDEKALGVSRLFRLKRNAEARKRRRKQRDQDAYVDRIYRDAVGRGAGAPPEARKDLRDE